jgi:hypothetical protein
MADKRGKLYLRHLDLGFEICDRQQGIILEDRYG